MAMPMAKSMSSSSEIFLNFEKIEINKRTDADRPSIAKPGLDEIEQYEETRKKQIEIRSKELGIPKDKFIMDDFDPTFKYYEKDLYFPSLKGNVTFMTVKAHGVSKIQGMLVDQIYKETRRQISKSIEVYTNESYHDPDFRPSKGQICLVKALTWRDIEELMKSLLGKRWYSLRAPSNRNNDIDNRDAGKWFRAICTDTVANYEWRLASAFLFTFLDTGRKMPIPIKNIRNIVFNYIHQPIMAPFFTLLLYNLEQIDKRTDEKVIEVFHKYRIVTLKVLALVGESFVSKLVNPTEIEMDLEFAVSHRGAPAKSHPHILGTPRDDEIITLDVTKFDIEMNLLS